MKYPEAEPSWYRMEFAVQTILFSTQGVGEINPPVGLNAMQQLEETTENIKEELAEPVAKISDKVDNWLDSFITMLPNMAVALVLFVLFIITAKATQKIFLKLLTKTSNNKALENLFGTIIYYFVLGTGIFIILEVLSLEKAVTSLLAGVGVVGLALGFAFQDIAANFVSGIILASERPFSLVKSCKSVIMKAPFLEPISG